MPNVNPTDPMPNVYQPEGVSLACAPGASDRSLALQLKGVMRRYGDFTAVDNLNLAVQTGEIYGFLGPNGAGKTTTIKMLVGLLRPNAGHIRIAGHDIWAEPLNAKRILGYVADQSILYERLTGYEFLAFLAQMRGIPKRQADEQIQYFLNLLDLEESASTLCGLYSFGMKRKLMLAGALIHKPSVLILDEPLNGLDPRSAHHVKGLFFDLTQQGVTIFLSTHDLATAENICHRVGIIHRGRLLAEGSANELRALTTTTNLEAVFLRLTEEQAEVSK